ncbi:gluconeogenesis factor YvcK family protein [Tomitella biformata]|uniref:gluconeogenesis factor YvcK family protein n=1 Tax=Tomitella biformata TaxID=630403 RepID=UPI0004666A75|nr:uridine diphosphate-N-acetylglucosamine-binding protein YvcK [Tomitella biformata]
MTSGPEVVRSGPAIVALGGGHGLYATLSAVRQLTPAVTAIVTVGDDGGSSGRLRSELGVIPPGDLRMALVALAAQDPEHCVWADVLQHRFGGTGALAGHSVGNLILAGLTEVVGDPVQALAMVGNLLGAPGMVLPMSRVPLTIEADVAGLEQDPRVVRGIRGQVAVATTPGQVRRVRLEPANPPAAAEAVAAVHAADMVVLGPGSWFTSVIPHLLVPELYTALQSATGHKVLVLNLAAEPGETAGFSAERHLHVLSQHAPDFAVDSVVVDAGAVGAASERATVERAALRFGARVEYADVAVAGTCIHDPVKLAAVLAKLGGARTPVDMLAAGSPARETLRGVNGEDSQTWR